jgi:C-terminal processing protease CtpA/Prc
MIAHVILRRAPPTSSASTSTLEDESSSSSAVSARLTRAVASLGLKVVGGHPNPMSGQPSAYVVRVQKDSMSDTMGRLQAGDEIIKWNETLLRGLTFDQVYAVMRSTKREPQIELVVERTLE